MVGLSVIRGSLIVLHNISVRNNCQFLNMYLMFVNNQSFSTRDQNENAGVNLFLANRISAIGCFIYRFDIRTLKQKYLLNKLETNMMHVSLCF